MSARPGLGMPYPRNDGDKKARSPGRARSSLLKPLRAGMLGVSGKPVVTTAGAAVYPFLPARLRVHWAPGIPHALTWAENNCKARVHRAARSRSCLKFEFEHDRAALLLSSPATGSAQR